MINETLYVCLNKSQYILWKSTDVIGNITLNTELINETPSVVFQIFKAFTPIMTNSTLPILYKLLIVMGVMAGIGVLLRGAYGGLMFLVLFAAYIYTIIKEIIGRIKK